MEKRNLLSKFFGLMLVLSIAVSFCGCGRLNEYQQQFVDAVGIAETATDENSLNMIKDAFLKYSTLSEKDAQNEKVVEAKTRLVSLFDSKVDTLSKEEMSASLDAKISELEAVVNDLPIELQNSIPGCEKLKTIRADHLEWYVNQNEILADKIDKINEQFEALNLEETVALIDETIPLLEELKSLSYENNLEELKKDFGIVSPAESIEVLEKVKNSIVEMCYTDTYVVRFEYICDHSKQPSNFWSGTDYFMYCYNNKSSVESKRIEYNKYLDAHFKLVSWNYEDKEWFFDVGNGKTIKVHDYIIDSSYVSYNIYGVMVTPPYMAPEEQGINT